MPAELVQTGLREAIFKGFYFAFSLSYQTDRLYTFPISDEKRYNRSHLVIDYIILSMTGKIIMECYADLFEFFTRLIRERLPESCLADGLIIDITD